MILIDSKPYERLPGTACFAPYVDVIISSLTGRKSTAIFKARVDSGADITCIPKNKVEKLMPLLLGRPLLIRGHDGTIKRMRTHLAIISMHGYPDQGQLKSYRPERGVLLTDSDVGLIGMDIISKYWNLTFDGVSQRFSVDCVSHQSDFGLDIEAEEWYTTTARQPSTHGEYIHEFTPVEWVVATMEPEVTT